MIVRSHTSWCWVLLGALLISACTLPRRTPVPGRTTLSTPLVVLPAIPISNYLLVEGKWDKHGPWRFLIDTGSSVTLVSPELARRYGSMASPPEAPQVRVRSADGRAVLLPAVTLTRLQLGDARFEHIAALVHDCSELTAHLGIKIDGILGFPLFRETILTLDYPQSRVLLTPSHSPPLLPGATIAFNTTTKTPVIPISIGDTTLLALIDSGSDGPLTLNPFGFDPPFLYGPRPGATVGTLTGNRPQEIGRLDQPLKLGHFVLQEPVVDLTDEFTSIGGDVLRHFTVSFNQASGQVTFYRPSTAPVITGAVRSAGLSFSKTPAYWRVVGVVPGSPADIAGVQNGDLVTRINGEPVADWGLRRYQETLRSSPQLVFSFLNGRVETPLAIETFDLVP